MSGDYEKFEKFLNKIRKTEYKNEAKTIPEVFGIQYREIYITKWLAYLLRQKFFGCDILNALLSISGSDIKIEDNDIEKVYTEYVFDTSRRIDILIFTRNFLVGIENKIWSGEQENQTSDYQDSMKKISSNKECIGIYLHPEQNRAESNNFKNVTYTELYDELSRIKIFDYPISFERIMYEQFMMYIKECLYMKIGEFPEISEKAKLYAENKGLIQDIESNYRTISSKVIEWLNCKFEKEGYIVLNNPRDDNEQYMQLSPIKCKDKWSQIRFHFEILWQNSLIIDSELKIDVHLENYKGIDKNLQKIFGLENDMERGDKNPLQREKLTGCSFGTLPEAEKSFERIMEVLKSDLFQNWAEKANTWTMHD